MEKLLSKYGFEYPIKLIAQRPASPRDSAKLLVYYRESGKEMHGKFDHLDDYIPRNALLVFNETKVIPARVVAKKETGGAVELLVIDAKGTTVRVLANKRLAPGMKLRVRKGIVLEPIRKTGQEWIMRSSVQAGAIFDLCKRHGKTPLPPYLKHSTLKENERR